MDRTDTLYLQPYMLRVGKENHTASRAWKGVAHKARLPGFDCLTGQGHYLAGRALCPNVVFPQKKADVADGLGTKVSGFGLPGDGGPVLLSPPTHSHFHATATSSSTHMCMHLCAQNTETHTEQAHTCPRNHPHNSQSMAGGAQLI